VNPKINCNNIPVNLAFFLGLDEPLWRDAKFIIGGDFVIAASFLNVETTLFQLLLMLFGTNQIALAIVVGITIPDFAGITDTPWLAG
jgi:hypothetical protein